MRKIQGNCFMNEIDNFFISWTVDGIRGMYIVVRFSA